MLYTYSDLNDRQNREKWMDREEPVSFHELLNLTLESMETQMFQGLIVLQRYLIVMHIFRYGANEKRERWKRKNEGGLVRSLEKANTFFFPGAKNLSASVVTNARTVKCCSVRVVCVP